MKADHVALFRAALASGRLEVLDDAGEVLVTFPFLWVPEFDPDTGRVCFGAVTTGMVERAGYPARFRIVAGDLVFGRGSAGPTGQVRIPTPPGGLLVGMQIRPPLADLGVGRVREVAP